VAGEGYLDPLDRMIGVAHHAVETLEQLAVQVDFLLVVVCENRMLRLAVVLGRVPIEFARALAVAGRLGGARERLLMARGALENARDHPVGLDLRRHHALLVAEVDDAAGGLDHPVEQPLLVVARAFELHRAFLRIVAFLSPAYRGRLRREKAPSNYWLAHVLVGEPVPTSPEHALGCGMSGEPSSRPPIGLVGVGLMGMAFAHR